MQIKSLHIDSYRHLHNISFDFTYPQGHAKFGKPLEKICIIGQSATGKTSILELIKDSISKMDSIKILNGKSFFHYFQLEFNGQLELFLFDEIIKVATDSININGEKYENLSNGSGTITHLFTTGLRLLYLSSEVISKEAINIFNQNPINILSDLLTEKYSGFHKSADDSNYIIEFVQNINAEIWFSLLYKILDYRKRFTQMASEIINKGAIADTNKLGKQYALWAGTNPNPLVEFANSFNPVLKKLNLEIDLVNTEYTIPIKSHSKDEVIPVSGLSTGTKGLLLSMFPLFELDTTDAMVLIDEPERSLFPDMQIDLMSHYENLAPNAQIIVATHSPFIAAAFEPEERFILYFDDTGEVAVRRGESPRGDDPNDMLRNDFNVDYYNDFGKQAYQQYLNLKIKAKQEGNPEKRKELVIELAALGDKYNF
jgi:AAA15 family ATPase/GTPase